MIHHVTLEADNRFKAEERLFWNLLGYHRMFDGTKPKWHPEWLINRDTRCAVHLHFRDEPCVPEFGHVAFLIPDFDRIVRTLRSFTYGVEDVEPHWGWKRAYTVCPSGHNIELMEGTPSIMAGMPKEGKQRGGGR